MFLTRRQWRGYTALTLGTFGLTAVFAFEGGLWSSVQFLWGCAWAWNLLMWAGRREERRRGYRIESRKNANGEIELRVVGRAP